MAAPASSHPASLPAPSQVMRDGTRRVAQRVKALSNVHRPNGQPNVFVFSLPRSGSTWLMELIWSQPGFKSCDEPTDLRNPIVRRYLGINEWHELYSHASTDRFFAYIQALCDGRLGSMNPRPLRRYYRPYTRRMVFKMIHGCEDRLNWLRDSFNGRIIHLVRHPIAVSLSREYFPTLPALMTSEYSRHFSKQQLDFAAEVAARGTKLERGVLSWCLQNAVPLRDVTDDWVVVSYEQLVVDPLPVMNHLADRLELPLPERMLAQITTPSGVKFKSDRQTQSLLQSDDQRQRLQLIEKWRERVGRDEERNVMSILDHFDIDLYQNGAVLPAERLWIRS